MTTGENAPHLMTPRERLEADVRRWPREAADTIDQLEAKVAHLNKECQTWEDRSIKFEAEVTWLKGIVSGLDAALKYQREETIKLRKLLADADATIMASMRLLVASWAGEEKV